MLCKSLFRSRISFLQKLIFDKLIYWKIDDFLNFFMSGNFWLLRPYSFSFWTKIFLVINSISYFILWRRDVTNQRFHFFCDIFQKVFEVAWGQNAHVCFFPNLYHGNPYNKNKQMNNCEPLFYKITKVFTIS